MSDSDGIKARQEAAVEFDDELSDEALDRPAETASPSSCFTAGRQCTACFAE
jgi:hypothetical protein